MKPTFISFYTDFDPIIKYYETCYLQLKNQFDSLSHKETYYFENLISPKSSYDKNCRKKPNFIIETQKKLNVPVVWIDIDSVLRTDELDFLHDLEEYDAAFVLRSPNIPEAFLMYFNNTENAHEMLKFYKEKCLDGVVNLDHYAIMELWKNKDMFNAKIKTFDSSYGSTSPDSKIQLGVSSFVQKRSIEKQVYNYRTKTNRPCH